MFFIFNSTCWLLVYRKTVDFLILILHPETCNNHLLASGGLFFCHCFWIFSTDDHIICEQSFIAFFSACIPSISFYCLIALAKFIRHVKLFYFNFMAWRGIKIFICIFPDYWWDLSIISFFKFLSWLIDFLVNLIIYSRF